jgi:hypothetical protein
MLLEADMLHRGDIAIPMQEVVEVIDGVAYLS